MLTEELTTQLISKGMTKFNLSLCTIDPEHAAAENRTVDLEHYGLIADTLRNRDIPSVTHFICGLKSDIKGSVAQNLRFLSKSPTLCGISLFYPVPGVGEFQDFTRFDSVNPSLCAASSAYPWNGSATTETLVTAFRLSRYANLLKQPEMSQIERDLVERIRQTGCMHTLVASQKAAPRIVPVYAQDDKLVKMFLR
jgi:hypothetical protein